MVGRRNTGKKTVIGLRGVIFILGILLCNFSNSPAQWSKQATQIFNSFPGSSGGTLYFKDGVLWAGLRQVLYSLDTGKTWNVSLASLSTPNEVVMNFDFLNSTVGLMRTASKLYLTQDGGMSWNVQTAPGNAGSRYSILAGSAAIVISLAQNGIYVSNDGGTSWTKKYTGANPNIAAYKAGGTIAVYEAGAPRLVISHDYGQTWIAKPVDINIADSYSMEWDKCDPNQLYLTNEDYFAHNQNVSEIFATANEGDTWISLIQKPYGYFNGGMTVSPYAAYFQTVNNDIFYTLDKGATWDSAGGPTNHADTRWISAVNGRTIMAADKNGDIWRFDNGAILAHPVFTLPKQLELTDCLPDSTAMFVRGLSCRRFHILNAVISGDNAARYKLNANLSYPFVIDANNDYGIDIRFDPQLQTGTFIDTLSIDWVDEDGGAVQTEKILLNANVGSSLQMCNLYPKQVVFDSVSACKPGFDTIVTVLNSGCDTISILEQPHLPVAGFTVDPLVLPVILPPDSSINVTFHFHPVLPGFFKTFSWIVIEAKGSQHILGLDLSGTATTDNFTGATGNTFIELDTVSSCSPLSDTTLTITNIGCVPMNITQGAGLSGTAFSLDPLTLPMVLPTDSTITLHFHFHPPAPGSYSVQPSLFTDWQGFGRSELRFDLHGISSISKAAPVIADTSINFGKISLCNPLRDSQVIIRNRSCDTLRIISGPASAGNGFNIDNISYPVIIPPDSSVKFFFHFLPGLAGNYLTTLHFVTERMGLKKDLDLSLIGAAINTSSAPIIPFQDLDLGTIPRCDAFRDTIVTITNFACNTLKIISGPGPLGNGFTADLLSLPIILLPNTSVNVTFHFRPQLAAKYICYPHFDLEREGIQYGFDMNLKAAASPGSSILSLMTPKISFAPITICDEDSAEIVYTNSGCDTLFVTPMGAAGDADFIAFAGSEQPLLQGEMIRIPIHFNPTLKGLRSAGYKLHCRQSSGVVFDTNIAISGFVSRGTRILVPEVTSVDFGSTLLCDAPDTVITIFNNGCDTLTFTDAVLSGTGFLLGGNAFPILLAPGESTKISVRTILDTAASKPTSTADLILGSNSDKICLPITITRSYKYPVSFPLELGSTSASSNSGDTYILELRASKLPKDLTRIDARINLDHPDMLSYDSVHSDNTVSFNGQILTITGKPVIAPNNVIAKFYYRVYLSKDSTCRIDLTDLRFNSYDAVYDRCIASSPGAIATFDYNFACGDRALMWYMNGHSLLDLLSIHPNPANNFLSLDIEAKETSDLEITIVDSKGSRVASYHVLQSKGRSDRKVDLSKLSSGSYLLNLKAGSSDLSAPFIIQK